MVKAGIPFRRPDLVIPFRLRGYDGAVSITYEINRDAQRLGFHLVGIPFDPALTHGFPVVQAELAFDGPGYHAAMGWVQVVTVEERSQVQQTWASVDTYPILWNADVPFVTFGQLPPLFDAPGPNPPRYDERWIAESFLVACPDVARTRRVRPVLGFRWGYDLVEMRATPTPLEVTTAADWARCAGVLREQYPNWAFEAEIADGEGSGLLM